MAEHTPGPWEARSDVGEGLTFWEVVRLDARDTGPTDPNRDLICDFGLHDNAEANAHIVAAAPDMLVALKALADKVDATSDCDHKRVACEDIGCIGADVKWARAAIARAEDRTP